ncbi:hypothetical protein CEXT_402241 [Caerostris extrusa]|uniref:Uncharacterized protein n=1 Tax=Caerostris extrusa TaxID=172846 RepID=A0AAV4PHI3_CAEEX|nr:hypothetical protein CEXT_402241 [Caerostris extrusa]
MKSWSPNILVRVHQSQHYLKLKWMEKFIQLLPHKEDNASHHSVVNFFTEETEDSVFINVSSPIKTATVLESSTELETVSTSQQKQRFLLLLKKLQQLMMMWVR